MKFVITVLIINFVLILNAEATMNHFFIQENKVKCALLDLDAELLIEYEIIKGNKSVKLDLSKVPGNQAGICSDKLTVTEVIFNISVTPTEILTFKFRNISNLVELTSIEFVYHTPNPTFPDAKNNGTVHGFIEPNIILSNISQYYECNSLVQFTLTNGINLRVASAKIKVFDVKNNTFGSNKKECSQLTSTIRTTKHSTKKSTTRTTKHSTKKSTTRTTKHSTKKSTTRTTKHSTKKSTTRTTKHSTKKSTTRTTKHLTTKSTTRTTKLLTTKLSTTQTTKHLTTKLSTTQTTKNLTTEPSTTQTTKNLTTKSSTTQTTKHLTTSQSSSHNTKSSMSSRKFSTRNPYSTTTAPQKDAMFYVNNTGNICLMLKSQLSISIKYALKNNKGEGTTIFNILSNASHVGICGSAQDALFINWHSELILGFIFTKKDTYSSLSQINLSYYTSEKYFPNAASQNVTVTDLETFNEKCKMPLKNYYMCSVLNFNIGKNVTLTLTDFKYEAFRNSTTTDFSKQGISCDSKTKSALVPIIVGVVLAAFLILVVVIFLIFRFRAQKRKGYEEI